ncbi:MAG: anti-sigma-D factor RsdA [Mycobacterium sp.]|uniref:anti-sigma-D factor RsdA n=1 Tax=Mycobacterium sp. TaxID=1785 RepID=UPI003F983D85
MPDFGFGFGDQPALDELADTDLLLDALAERRPVRLDDPDDDVLATLLEDWRDNLRWPPASALVAPEEAIGALHTGLADRQRARRGMAAIGSVAATLLVLSGFGAMVVEARPGDTLYGLHAMFFDQPKVNENQVMLSAKADLAKVQQMIDEGQWDQAQSQLAEVSSMVQSMNDGADRNDLQNRLKLLNTRIESRNPNATLPPPAASTTPVGSTPTTTAPTTSQPSSSANTSPSPSAGRHRHHSHTTSPAPVAPSTDP